jgi:hypothetical protein
MKEKRGKGRKERDSRNTILFLKKLDRFLQMTSRKVARLDPAEFEVPEWRKTTPAALDRLRAVLPEVRRRFAELGEDRKVLVDQAVDASGIMPLLESFHETLRRGSPTKTALEVVGSIIIGIGDLVGAFDGKPVDGFFKLIGRVLGDISKKMPNQAVEDLEHKLDFIMDLPQGGEIPSAPEEGTQPVSLTQIKREIETVEQKLHFIMDLPEGKPIPPVPPGVEPVSLTLLKTKLDNLAARLGEILTGQHVPVEPGETISRPPHPIKAEIEDIEKKLDFIMDLPEGKSIPPRPPAGTDPVSLTLLKTKLDNLAARLGEILVGPHITIEPGETVSRPPHPIKAEIQDLEKKLDFIMDLPVGESIPPPPPAGTRPVSLTEIKKEIEDVEKKLHFIMDLPKGVKIPPPPPAGTKPVSLTQIEKKLDFIMDLPKGKPIPPVPPGTKPVSLTQIGKKLDFIMDLPKGKPIPPVPPGVKPVSLTQINRKLEGMKKIFVAEEGVFAAASPGDARVINISAPSGSFPRLAFDLSGWIDLTRMRNGDEVTVKLEVAMPGGGLALFTETRFADAQSKGLKHFRDFADGVQGVVGTRVRITIKQASSVDNFLSPVNVPFLFVVESP